MTLETPRLKREYRTMQCMVEIYCRDHHAAGADGPCEECRRFLGYAEQRLLKKGLSIDCSGPFSVSPRTLACRTPRKV